MSVRVRFKVQTHRATGGDDRTVIFVPVDDKTIDQAQRVSPFAPSGRLELFITNPDALALLPIDSEVYVDIVPVDQAKEFATSQLETEAEQQARLGDLIAGNADACATAIHNFGGGESSVLDKARLSRDLDILSLLEKNGKNRTSVMRAIEERRARC